jgi:hypothetical protein
MSLKYSTHTDLSKALCQAVAKNLSGDKIIINQKNFSKKHLSISYYIQEEIMNIHTTISMHLDRKIWIEEMLVTLQLDFEDLIKICLKLLAPEIRKQGFKNGSRKYQKTSYLYEAMHFSMTNTEYSIYADLQKVSKCCFSKLVAMALDMFAEQVLTNGIVDSYQETQYINTYITYKNIQYYVFCWKEFADSEENQHPLIE